MKNPILYRRRIIPEECILLKDDRILFCDEDHIVTAWNTLHPKKDLHHGWSCYFLKEGFKVSRFCREDGSLLYWYCDIVDFDYKEEGRGKSRRPVGPAPGTPVYPKLEIQPSEAEQTPYDHLCR